MSNYWRSTTLDELQADIRESESRMSAAEAQFWRAVRVAPCKWTCSPYGDEGGGFWVVAVIGRHVLWYNDIEEGFNFSRYTEFGRIDNYMCDQSDLRDRIRTVLDAFTDDGAKIGNFSSPQQLPLG